MINANDITHFNRCPEDLLEFWLFALFVRGKNADVQAAKLEKIVSHAQGVHRFVCDYPRAAQLAMLKLYKVGQYESLMRAIQGTAERLANDAHYLSTASAVGLEQIPGVGPKTSRFFIMHSREDARVAALDTHILRFLRLMGHQAPQQTPSGSKYVTLETEFLSIADDAGVSPSTMDLAIWKAARGGDPLAWRTYL